MVQWASGQELMKPAIESVAAEGRVERKIEKEVERQRGKRRGGECETARA